MLLRESMGVVADGSNKAFPSRDVDAFLSRPRAEIYVEMLEYHSHRSTCHFLVAVDPAGGGASAFAVSSMAQLPDGKLVVRCCRLPNRPNRPSRPPPPMANCRAALRATSRRG